MNNSGSTRFGYMSLKATQPQIDQHKAEMSLPRLGILLCILSIVWILCYNAEKQFPARHIQQTYNRIGQQQVTKQSLKWALDIVSNQGKDKKVDQPLKYKAYLQQKYHIGNEKQNRVCVLLIHKEKQENWMKSVQSLLSQQYTNYKIYYLNNYQSGAQIMKYIQSNSLDKNKFKIVSNIENTNYLTQFKLASNYCQEEDNVIYLYDDDTLIGNHVFTLINQAYAKNPQLILLYTDSLFTKIQQKGKVKKLLYKLGKAYKYPEQIVKGNQYSHYPYLVDGLLTFKGSLLQEVDDIDLKDSKGEAYERAGQVALGVKLLELAKQNVDYIAEPLVLRGKQRNFISQNAEFREQITDIANKH